MIPRDIATRSVRLLRCTKWTRIINAPRKMYWYAWTDEISSYFTAPVGTDRFQQSTHPLAANDQIFKLEKRDLVSRILVSGKFSTANLLNGNKLPRTTPRARVPRSRSCTTALNEPDSSSVPGPVGLLDYTARCLIVHREVLGSDDASTRGG